MKIKPFYSSKTQMITLGNHSWSIARLFELSKDLPLMEIPLDHICVGQSYNNLTLRDMVTHINAIRDADLSFPIVLDEDGELMDGRHRIMKALFFGNKTIKAVRFDINPNPCIEKND